MPLRELEPSAKPISGTHSRLRELEGPKSVQHAPGVTGRAGPGSEYDGEQRTNVAQRGGYDYIPPTDPKAKSPFYYDTNDKGSPLTNAISWGTADEIISGVSAPFQSLKNRITGGGPTSVAENYRQNMADMESDLEKAREERPIQSLVGELGGSLLSVAPAAKWAMGGKGLFEKGLRGALVGRGTGEAYGFADAGGSLSDRIAAAREGGNWGAGIGAAVPVAGAAGRAIGRGAKATASKVTRPVSRMISPKRMAEKDLARENVSDWLSWARFAEKEAADGRPVPQPRFLDDAAMAEAEAAGQHTMVSDMSGDRGRALLKAASVKNPDARETLLQASGARQALQGKRWNETVSNLYGGKAGLDPVEVDDAIRAAGKKENDANYGAARANPRADHIWIDETDNSLQRMMSTSFGRQAVEDTIKKSRDEALKKGQEILTPQFAEDERGLLQFQGMFNAKGELVSDKGLSLDFWDKVKQSLDDQIEGALGKNEKGIAGRIKGLKNEMLDRLDSIVPEYKKARSVAQDFFGFSDAHEAGLNYFNKMDAYSESAARKAMKEMSENERKLFSRGYIAAVMHKIENTTDGRDVTAIFNSQGARRRMAEAIGEDNVAMLEAYNTRSQTQRLLGTLIQSGSDTARNQEAQKNFGFGAAGGVAGYSQYSWAGVLPGIVAGIVARAGGRVANDRMTQKYAAELARLAVSTDPKDIQRVSNRMRTDSRFRKYVATFNNIVSKAQGNAGQSSAAIGGQSQPAAGQQPQIGFAGGGLVKKAVQGLERAIVGGEQSAARSIARAGTGEIDDAGPILSDVVTAAKTKKPGKKLSDDISDMPRLFDLSELEGIPDVEQRMLERYIPKKVASERARDLVGNKIVQRNVSEAMERGVQMGAKGWYNNEPLRRRFVEELGKTEGNSAFRDLIDFVAATSPRSKVPENVRNASYYYERYRKQALPNVGDKNPQPYGHLAQRLHQMNARRVALDGWDPLTNPKPASFAENLFGNQMPGTIDTHATRLPAIASQDPRWLAKQLVVVDPITKEKINLSPRKMFDNGEITMEEAVQRPAYWEAQPAKNEYAAIEQMYADLAKEQGMTTAQGQAAAWAGGGDATGLASVGSDPFLKVFEDRILLTAKKLGVDPNVILKRVIRGQMPLLKDGGLVTSALSAAA